MSEHVVIILLIALTLVIVLIALSIPDEPSGDATAVVTADGVAVEPATVASSSATNDQRYSDGKEIEFDGEEVPEDARRAADVPEEADR